MVSRRSAMTRGSSSSTSRGCPGDALAEAIADVDAVLVRSATKITRESLAQSGAAQGHRPRRRRRRYDRRRCRDRARNRGAHRAVGQHDLGLPSSRFALLLALVRRVPAADRSMHAGAWDRKSFGGTELYGKTLGLVGAGRIGGEVAKRARAFGMRVLVYDPVPHRRSRARSQCELATLDEVLARADVISLHVPLTDGTQGLIGRDRLARMKRGALAGQRRSRGRDRRSGARRGAAVEAHRWRRARCVRAGAASQGSSVSAPSTTSCSPLTSAHRPKRRSRTSRSRSPRPCGPRWQMAISRVR